MAGSTEATTSAGAFISLSAALPATVNAAGYAALSYTEIGQVTDLGSIGRTYNMVNHNPLKTRGTEKLKGSYDDGTVTIQAAYAPGDAGQILVATALDDDDWYSAKITLRNGTILYAQAQVMSAPINIGSVDTVTGTTIGLSIKSGSIVPVQPA